MTDFHAIESGQGLPAVLMHGMMGWPENWQGLFPHLPDTCHAIALEFPFFNDKRRLDSVEAVVAYASDFIEQRGLRRFVLAGNSLGGHAALVMALRMPEKVAGIVLSGSSGLFERGFKATQGSRPSREWVHDRIAEIFHDSALASDELVDAVCRIIAERSNARDIIRIAKSAKHDNLADRLSQIRCPVLLVWGRQDSITPPEVAEEFHEKLPNCELHWIDRCCHAPMMEHPKEFAEAMGAWWRRHIVPQPAGRADGVRV